MPYPTNTLFKQYLAGLITFREYLRGGCEHQWVEESRGPIYLGTGIYEKCSVCGKANLRYAEDSDLIVDYGRN